MTSEGPPLETLTHRLAECPAEFLEEPLMAGRGKIHAAAVASDLLRDLGGAFPIDASLFGAEASASTSRAKLAGRPPPLPHGRNRLRLVLIVCWLLHDVWFREQKSFATSAYELLAKRLGRLAELIEAPRFVSDPDRREELVRYCLKELGLRPSGETVVQAQDRLTTLDSVELRRVMQDTKKAEERARKIREAIAKKAQEEAAAKISRE